MANFFTDNFADTNTDDYSASRKAPGEIAHARKRYKRMQYTSAATTADDDTVVLGKFKSGDRLISLTVSTDSATPDEGIINVGLYVSALNHVPVAANIIDVDLFASALALITEVDRVDAATEAGTIEHHNLGITLWEMAALGAASYTVDPMQDFDLVLTFTEGMDAAQKFVFEAEYVSFG